MFFLAPAQAQKKYIYQDTSLLQKEEEYKAPAEVQQTETIPIEKINELIKDTVEEKSDTSLFENYLTLPVDSIQHWKNLKDFAYAKYLDSLLKDSKLKHTNMARSEPAGPGLFNSFLSSSFLQFLLWTLAVCFIMFIIYRLFIVDGVFKRESKNVGADTADVAEELITNESDFNTLIKQALQNNNFRQAVRYQYLKTLHTLADKKYVELAPDKTNFQYVHEISNREYQNEFAALTLNYEYVWYGEFVIEKNIYQKIEMNFNNLNQKL